MMVIMSAFLLPVAKIVKLIPSSITKMGFALECYPCYPAKKIRICHRKSATPRLSEYPFSAPGDDRQSQIHICQQSTELILGSNQLRKLEVGNTSGEAKLAVCT